MNWLGVEVGNVLTRAMAFGAGREEPVERATPTTAYAPCRDPRTGLRAVLSDPAFDHLPGPPPGRRIALVHLHGLPRAAVIGLTGLATTELTMQAVLRQAGSSIVQVKSTDAASLEAQLIDVRSLPLDLVVFTGPARQTAQRLLAGGGLKGRTPAGILAFYNGPAGDHHELAETIGSQMPLTVLPPIRLDSQRLDPGPTEAALREATGRILGHDRLAAEPAERGFQVETYGRALTAGTERLAAWWREEGGPAGEGRGGRAPGLAAVELGGRYAELAVAGSGPVARAVADLQSYRPVLGSPGGRAGDRRAPVLAAADQDGEPLDVGEVGRWLPFDWTPAGLGDTVSNYLRRPFVFPSRWMQLMVLMALGRERLARLRVAFRAPPGDASLTGNWRQAVGRYLISGGYVRYQPTPALALALAIDGLEPVGVSEIWCDRWGTLPYLAAMGCDGPELVGGLTRLATVVSPLALRLDWRRPHGDDILALVTISRQGGADTSFRMVPGALVRYGLRPGEQARLTIHPLREHDFGAGPGKPWRGTVTGGRLGLVLDGRGRPVALPGGDQIRQAKLLEWLGTLGLGATWGDGAK